MHLNRSEGSEKIKIDGRRKRERARRQWERDILDVFDMLLTEVGRLAVDRESFRCAVNDATSNRIGS